MASVLFISADPGMEGAWAAIDETCRVISYMKTPRVGGNTGPIDLVAICDWLRKFDLSNYDKVVMTVEDVHALFKVSASSTGTLMESKGQIEGIMSLYAFANDKVSYQMLAPKTWQKEVWTHADKVFKAAKVDTKATSLSCAKKLWPTEKFLATPKCKVPHDGIVDALLICEAARRRFNLINTN